jgi:internalin A
MIRDTFTKIHNSFANLEISQWVPVPGYPDADPLDYDELLGLEDMGENTVRVGKLKLKLDLRKLLDGYESIELRRRRQMGDEFSVKEYDGIEAHSSAQRIIYNLNLGGNKMTHDSPKTNHFNAPMSGVIGSDNAEVTNNQFIQNNNTNTAELLKLISSMRETANQFPEDLRDEIIIDIEDIETEIQKPENQWNKNRLKKSLKAIVAAVTAIAIPIAGITYFANTAIELGQRVGVELKLPPGR